MRIENDCIAVSFDPKSGGIVSLYDKRLSREYVAAPDRAILFRCMVPEKNKQYLHTDAAGAECTQEGTRVRVRSACNGIRAEASFVLENDALAAQLRLENAGDVPIEETIFPWLGGLGPQAGASLVWPVFWERRTDDLFGKRLGGDHRAWNGLTQQKVARYPSHMASAWCEFGNEEGGLALEGRHTDFSILDFHVAKHLDKTRDPIERTLSLATSHPRRILPGGSWVSPPVRISLHEGDWRATADAHREWLDTWILKPDRPAKFAEAIGWHFFFMKHQDGLELNTYADLPDMASAALAAGCPYLMVFGWQTGGHDNNYFYRYVPNEEWGGAEALRAGIQAARMRGVEILPFFNGTLANIEMEEHKAFGHRWEAKTREGHPYYAGDWARHNYDVPTRNRSLLHHEIAPCREQRAYFLETVKRIVQDYGFGNTQLDQISEKMFVDYDETHIETTPDRVYVDGLAELLPGVRRLVREANPEGVMVSECLNDFTGQWCDSSWDWNILLPFPDPILYTLPWLMASHELDACEYGEANTAFAYKMHFDMKIDGGDSPITKYPRFAEHVKQLAALRRRAADYCVHGDFRAGNGMIVEGGADLLATLFHNRQTRKTGIVVAECANRETEVTVYPSFTYSGNPFADSNRAPIKSLDTKPPWSFTIAPYEILVLCFDDASAV